MKNMNYSDECLYVLYDTESPLAKTLSDAYISVLENIRTKQKSSVLLSSTTPISIREFKNPPQPLYRGGMINPDNPHLREQNRIITSHNVAENMAVGLDHHEKYGTKITNDRGWQSGQILPTRGILTITSQEWHNKMDPACVTWVSEQILSEQESQIASIKNELISLPKGSIVILIQSTNFRLSTFRIRLELFHLGIHVVEFNHLAYISDIEIDTFIQSLTYRTPEYVRLESIMGDLIERNNPQSTRVESIYWGVLNFWPLEKIRGNTGDYTNVINKWGTFPIGEVFTEAIDLESVNGKCLVESYPNEDFSVNVCEPFELCIEKWRVLPSPDFPPAFQKLYDWVILYEWEVMVRELGFGLNPSISTTTPLSDINFYERKLGVHLSLGKKHGIYGKKLPKTEVQRFHIDVFVALWSVYIGETQIFENGRWIV